MMAAFRISVVCALLALLPTPIMSQGTCQCENGGQCLYDESGAGIRCVCPVGYRGILCDIQDANCLCENGGICSINAEDDYVCSCMEGYDGPLCQYVPLVDDKLPPDIFNCPSDFEARRQPGEDSVYVTWEEPYATDNSGEAPSVFRNIAPNFYARSNYDVQVFYRYTDQMGLTSECRFTVTVIYSDGSDPRPVVSGCPSNINVTAMGSLRTAVDWVEPTLGSTGQEVISVDRSHVPGSLFFLGSTLVTYRFLSDTNQVMSMCTFTVTVTTDSCRCENGGICIPDEVKSGVMCMCPAGYSGILCQEGACQCLNNGMCLREAGNTVMCSCPRGYRGVLCEEMDDQCDCENGGTCVHDSTVPGGTMCICPAGFGGILCNESTSVDTVPPTVTFCPESFNLSPNSSDPIAATWPQPRAEDDSGLAPSVDQNVPVGTLMNPGDVLDVVYKFTDAAGNAAFCNFTITFKDQCDCENGGTCVHDTIVPGGTRCICPAGFGGILCSESTSVDTVPPTVTFCPESFNLSLTSSEPIAATWPQPRAEDDSGLAPSVDQNIPMGTLMSLGDVLDVVYKFTDAAGNVAFCNFTITAVADVDTVPPTVTFCPESFNLSLTSSEPITATWTQPEAEDDSGLAPTVDQNIAMGTLMSLGDVLDVVYKFSDAAGNAAFCNFTITAVGRVDTAPPTVTFCPENFNLSLTSSEPIAATWTQPRAEDDSGLAPSVDQNIPMGTLMSLGDVLDVVHKFTDAAGNVAFCNFTITAVDDIPPTIRFCPPNIENLAPNPTAMIFVTWAMPQVSDNLGGPLRVLASSLPGIFVMAGSAQTVTYVFTDESGNEARCMFNIVITVLESPESVSLIDVTTTSAMLSVVPPNATFDSYVVKVQDQELTFPATESILPLSDLMPGTNYQVSVITAISYGTSNQVTSEPFNLEFTTVFLDTTRPVISGCPSDITLPAGQNVANWTEPTAVDNSGLVPAVNKSHEPGAVFADESTNVSYTFTDVAGNMAKCVFTVTRILVLEPPMAVSLINVTTTYALLSLAPPNVNFDLYIVRAQSQALAIDVNIPAAESTVELPGLMPGTNYTVSVSTAVAYGTGNEVVSDPVSLDFTTVLPDTTVPLISGCPSDITLPAGQNVANWTEPTAIDNSGLVPAVNKSHEPGAVFADESTNVSYTFTDAAGNVAKCVFTVTRILVLDPPSSISITDVTSSMAFVTWTPPNSTFDVYLVVVQGSNETTRFIFPKVQDFILLPNLTSNTNYTVSVSTAVAHGAVIEILSEPVVVTLTTLEAPDTMPPMVTGCPSDITLPAGQNVANWTEPTAVDNSGLVPAVNKSHEPGAVFADESTNVSYTFTDAAGNMAKCVFTVTRILVLDPPGSISITDVTSSLAFLTWTPPNSTFDVYLVVVQGSNETRQFTTPKVQNSIVLPNLTPNTNYTVSVSTAVAYGTANEIVSQPVSVTLTVLDAPDTMPPMVTGCPSDITLPAGQNVANWTEPTAVDNSGLVPAVNKSHESGAVFADESTNVSYTFTDAAGNMAKCVFTVTRLFDVTPPVVSGCPDNITLPLGATIANWTEPTATDDSGSPPSVLKSHEPGASFLEGNTNVTYTFTDGAGNQAVCAFLVTVTFDKTAPVISNCPGNILLPFASTLASWTEPTATDNSGEPPSVTKTHEPGTEFSDGNTTVVYTFSDAAGNQANCSFVVTVVADDVAPFILNCPSNISLPFGTDTASWTEPTASDNSGLVPSVDRSHEPGAVFTEDSTMVTYTFTDASGNQANCVFLVIRLRDDIRPEITTCPSIINLTPGTNVATWDEPTATDNSGEIPTFTRTHEPGSVFTENVTMVVYTFTDAAGNEALCVFFVKLAPVDMPPMIFNCPSDFTMTLLLSEIDLGIFFTWREPFAVDDSGLEPTVNKTHSPGIMFPAGSTRVVYTFTDNAGNQAECAFVVNVLLVDDIRPVITGCPSDMNVTLPLTQQSDIMVTWQEPSATDNSGAAPSLDRSHQPGETFPEGTTTVTYTFSDQTGNEAVCSFEINVQREEDVTPPQILNCPLDQAYVIPAGNQFMIIMWNPPTAIDNSGVPPSVVSNRIPGDVFGIGETVVMYNFTDPSDNMATCEFTIKLSTPVLNPCQSSPCRPNENCFYSATTFICVAGPFRKRRDVLDMKDDVMDICPCENGGVCLKETGSKGTRCICPEGLTGILCKEAGDKGNETALQSSWKFLGLISLGALSLLVAMLLAVFHIKRQRTGKLGYDISSMAFKAS